MKIDRSLEPSKTVFTWMLGHKWNATRTKNESTCTRAAALHIENASL
jgi:hypothetical protein